MRHLSRRLLATLAIVPLVGCHAGDGIGPSGRISADASVRWMNLEGGFYALQSSLGNFDPINLPAAYQQDGLAVHFIGTVRRDMVSTHMYGQILEISAISKR